VRLFPIAFEKKKLKNTISLISWDLKKEVMLNADDAKKLLVN